MCYKIIASPLNNVALLTLLLELEALLVDSLNNKAPEEKPSSNIDSSVLNARSWRIAGGRSIYSPVADDFTAWTLPLLAITSYKLEDIKLFSLASSAFGTIIYSFLSLLFCSSVVFVDSVFLISSLVYKSSFLSSVVDSITFLSLISILVFLFALNTSLSDILFSIHKFSNSLSFL